LPEPRCWWRDYSNSPPHLLNVTRDDRFEFHIGGDTRAQDHDAREVESDTVRVAVIGNFSGRAESMRHPRVWPVDLDNFDTVIAASRPRLRLVLDSDLPVVDATFSSLDDFHPDGLSTRLAIFETLRALRDAPPSPAPAASSPSVDRIAADELTAAKAPTGSFLDMIIDADPATPIEVVRQAAPKDELSDFVARSVKKHARTDRPAQAAEHSAKVDALMATMMRVILHHPEFQALESLWRGVAFLLRRLETDGRLRLFLVDAAPDQIDAALTATADRGWSVVVVDRRFGADDVAAIERLAHIAAQSGVAVIAGAAPAFIGVSTLVGHDDVEDWPSDAPAGWDELRQSSAAENVSLVLPRVLLRLPYGRGGEECETFRFEEVDVGIGDHESYLWGNGAFAVAAIALAPVPDGDAPATHGTLDNMPLRMTSEDGLPVLLPCAEVLLGEREMANLLDRGLTPLASMRDGDMVRAPRVQAIARPARRLAIRV
jgi:type VI secretion system protein ImpC